MRTKIVSTGVTLHRHTAMAAVLSLVLLVTACINPFQTTYDKASGDDGNSSRYATLRVSSEGIGTATIAPDLAVLKGQISSYTLTLTNNPPGTYDPIVINGYTEGAPINGIPVPSDWTLSFQGFNASAELVAEGTPIGGNPISFPDATPVNVSVVLEPLTAGTGELDFTLDWSAAVSAGIQVDEVEVTLYSFATTVGESLILSVGNESITFTNNDVSTTATATVNFATETLTVTDPTLNSGSYRLTATLLKVDGGSIPYAPVIEAVQIYDNLLSSGTVTLVAGDLTSPPAPPEDLTATIIGDGELELSWTDTSNTETGYRVYQDGFGQVGGDLPPNATSLVVPGLTGGVAYTFEVAAFNIYGESTRATGNFVPVSLGGPPVSFTNGPNTNDASWAALSDPGTLDWNATFEGAETYTIYVSTNATEVANRSGGVVDSGDTAVTYDLVNYGPFTGNTTYYYLIEGWNSSTVGSIGVASAMGEFTIRDGNLYVATTGIAGAAGSIADPFDSITEAVQLAGAGERIRVAQGSYNEAFEITEPVIVQGGWSSDFSAGPDRLVYPTAIVGPGVSPIEIVSGTVATRIRVNAPGTVGIEDITVEDFDGGAWSNRNAIYLGSGNLEVRNAEVRAGIADPFEAVGIQVANANSGLDVLSSDFIAFDSIDGGDISNATGILVSTVTYDAQVSVTDSSFNQFNNRGSAAALMFYSTMGTGSTVFSGNTIEYANATTNPRIQAVQAFGGSGAPAALVENNTIIAVESSNTANTYGIRVNGTATTTEVRIVGNYVSIANHAGFVAGIDTDTVNPTIANNVVYIEGGNGGAGDLTLPALVRTINTGGSGYQVVHNTLVAADGPSTYPMRGIAGRNTGMRAFNNIILNTGNTGNRPFYSFLGDNLVGTYNTTSGGSRNNAIHGQTYVLWLTGFAGGTPEPEVRFETVANMNADAWHSDSVDIDPIIDPGNEWRFGVTAPAAVTDGGRFVYSGAVPEDRDGIARPDPPSIGAYQN